MASTVQKLCVENFTKIMDVRKRAKESGHLASVSPEYCT